MSLMHLLTVGRSFLSVQDRPTAYRVTEQRFLPKFGGAGAAASGGGAVGLGLVGRDRGDSGRRWRFGVVNPFRVGGRREGARRPVQGELALDTVKVVRNDLMETDFEVVPGSSVALERGDERSGGLGRWVRSVFWGCQERE